jgi:phosphohistidine phosphatase SixA
MAMRLYLVQHGKAKSEAEDPERSLTVRGEEESGDEGAKAVLFRYSAILCLEKKEPRRWAINWFLKPEIV